MEDLVAVSLKDVPAGDLGRLSAKKLARGYIQRTSPDSGDDLVDDREDLVAASPHILLYRYCHRLHGI